jgi:hypothetical protein
MITYLLTGMLTALGFWIILMKLNIKKVLNFEVGIDVLFTVGMVAYLAGTFSGVMTGVVAGITLSLLLALSKKIFGVEKINLKRWKIPNNQRSEGKGENHGV